MDGTMDVSEINDLTVRVVKLFLINVESKIPIKRADIVKNALRGNAKCFPRVLDFAITKLRETYGIEVKEVPDMAVKQYICISSLPCASLKEYTEQHCSTVSLLFVILSGIYMKGNPVTGENLLNFLETIGFNVSNQNASELALRKQVTDTFVKQLYLKREKYESDISPKKDYLYSWGYRSDLEIPKEVVLKVVSKLFAKQPNYFVKQFSELENPIPDQNESDAMDTTES